MSHFFKMAELEKSVQKRQVACKVRIKDIVNGKYVKEEGWKPNYVVTGSGANVSRLNVIATIVQKEVDESGNKGHIVLDDGSGKISVRSFDNKNIFKNIGIGDVVMLIGRPREFGNEKYVLAEILKQIDPLWVKVRKLELEKTAAPPLNSPETEEAAKEIKKETENLPEKVFNLVKEIDRGDGADIEEVISRSKLAEAEKIITGLLEAGELFEIRSGKLKVLE